MQKKKRQKRLSVVFIFFDHVAPLLRGLKKIYIIFKGKTNFLIKNSARGPLEFFKPIFKICNPPPPPKYAEKNLKKFSRLHMLNNYFM